MGIKDTNRIALGGTWALHDEAGTFVAPFPMPGDVHSALMAAGRIPDPMLATNEQDVQWVAEREWEIRRTFEVTPADLADAWPVLDLEFVDTIASLTVNGVAVAELESSFIRHRVDLTGVVRAGTNEIALRFHSAITEAKDRAARLPFPVPWSVSNNRVSDLNTIRKAQCHGGWDWGPCLMAIGVYAEPVLHLFRQARIEHAIVHQHHHEDGSVTLTADVELCAGDHATVPLAFTFGGETARRDVVVHAEHGGHARLSIVVDAPELWWPAGYGDQPLHDATIAIPGDRVVRRIGIRKLELVNEPDAAGMSMTFRINGVDIFAKGANWIPADALPARITPARIAAILGEAVAANMNMVRVWGGGFYEFDAFYETCDRLGLLVWQDMMFSCSQYPSTPEFLKQVDAEVRYQVKRLGSHACIAIWCGDNEVIGSLNWYEASKQNRDRYLVNYDRLNRVLELAITESDPHRPFWPSSPCSGKLDYGDAWHKDGSGDMHFWAVWHENRDFEHYHDVRPRFCSEFGFQAFPTMHVIRRFAEEKDWNATAPVMEFHQRDQAGNKRIVETMARYFRMPDGFANFLYLSQLQQALAIETAVRFWRSLKPHTMGTLYWQLNDVWPAMSWSSLDHALGWKTLHYHARRFYAPVALAARIDGDTLRISGLNDTHHPVPLDLRIRRTSADSTVLDETSVSGTASPDRSTELAALPVPASRDFIVVVDARMVGAPDFDPDLRFVLFADKPKRFDLPPSVVSLADGPEPGTFVVSADGPAFFVKPEASEFAGAFSDASFTLLPGETRTLRFRSRDGRTPGRQHVDLRHLGQSWR